VTLRLDSSRTPKSTALKEIIKLVGSIEQTITQDSVEILMHATISFDALTRAERSFLACQLQPY
jgi:hypothetical protein